MKTFKFLSSDLIDEQIQFRAQRLANQINGFDTRDGQFHRSFRTIGRFFDMIVLNLLIDTIESNGDVYDVLYNLGIME